MLRKFCVVVAVLSVETAAAAPRTIADCEAIQAADAYNRCLASFGPAAHVRHGRSHAAAFGSIDARRPAYTHGSGVSVERVSKSRLRMTLTPRQRRR